MSTVHANKVLQKLRTRNCVEVAPFLDIIELNNRLIVANSQLLSEREEIQFINVKLKEETQKLRVKSSEADQEQVSLLEKKLFGAQEELTELHRRRGENAQQIIDQSNQSKEHESRIKQLQDLLEASGIQLKNAQDEVNHLRSAMHELEATNQLLKDEYQTLQLTLNSAEQKLVEVQKENSQLVGQIMEFKDRDVLRLNQENDRAMRLQQERIKKQLEEAVAETKSSGSGGSSISPFNIFRMPKNSEGKESLESAICHSVRLPTRCFLKFEAHEGDVNAVKWSPHGLTLATGGSDRRVKIWDISKNICELKSALSGSNGAISSLDYEAGASLILAASTDFASRVWSIDDGRLRHTLTGHSNKVLAAKFMSGDANKVVTASYDRTVKVWDLRSKACVLTKFPGSSCNDVVCTDENNVVSGHFDKKIRFWDIRSGTEPIGDLEFGGKVTSVDVSRNGTWLLACCRDDTLRLVDARTCQLVRTYTTEGFQVAADWSRACFSPDSEYITVGAANGKIYIWSVHDNSKPETVLPEHSAPVLAAAWQPAGNSLTTCDKNKTVVVWAAI